MSVKSRLIALLAASVLGLALVVGCHVYGSLRTGRTIDLENLAVQARTSLLQARRHEKNFLLRKDMQYVAKAGESVEAAMSSLSELERLDPDKAAESGQAVQLFRAYGDSLAKVAELEEIIGLTEYEGLRAKFVAAARSLEAEFDGVSDKDVLIALLQLRRQEKNYLIRGTETYLEKSRAARRMLDERIESMELSPEKQAAATAALGTYGQTFDELATLRAEIGKVKTVLIGNARAVEPVVQAIRDHYVEQRERVSALSSRVGLGVGVVTALLVALFILWVIRSITGCLTSLTTYSREVSHGRLDVRPVGTFSGEFAGLRDDISHMVGELKTRLDEVREKEADALAQADSARMAMEEARRQETRVSELWTRMRESARRVDDFSRQVSDASAELTAMIEQVKKGADVQSVRMSETATAMEQMNAAIVEVARNSGDASRSARDARSRAESGADMVDQAIAAISLVSEHAGNMQQGIENLGNQVESIGQIMGVINEIADQTNLLALNAAIEAARAGDAGRGFAVVADEVRKLAEKTMSATKEVDASIQAIQESTDGNITTMRQAVEAVARSSELAGESGRTQQDIVSLVEDNSLQVDGIASAAEQQSASSEQINRAVDEVSRIAGESALGMERSYQAVTALNGLAGELQDMIRSMLADEQDEENAAAEAAVPQEVEGLGPERPQPARSPSPAV